MPSLTILLLFNATPSWLRLSRHERRLFFSEIITPIFEQCKPNIHVRIFDSEYTHARVSDFMIVETNDYAAYQLFIENLRDTKVYSTPYFEIHDIIIGQENAFQKFDAILLKNT